MVTTRRLLESIGGNMAESMGARERDLRPALSPVPLTRDVGRSPIRDVGRVAIELVIPDPDQPRVEFTQDALDRLAQSIRDKGQLSPIRVRWSEGLGKWLIVSGERRWRATRLAGLPTIDCHFHEGDLSRSEVLEQQLIENLLREDLQPIEEARAFSALIGLNGWSGKQLAESLRIPASKVTRSLALLKLPADMQESVARGEIAARPAYELSRVNNEEGRRSLAERAAAGAITSDGLARAVRSRKGKAAPRARSTRLSFAVSGGWKVVVSAGNKGSYHAVEQALVEAIEEVRARIRNNVQLF